MSSPETPLLEAVDAALAGRAVDPEHADVARLVRLVREDRPALSPAAAGRIDARVAARRRRRRPLLPPLRTWMLAPAAGVLAAVLVALAVVLPSGNGGTSGSSSDTASPGSGAAKTQSAAPSAGVAPPAAAVPAPATGRRVVQRSAVLGLDVAPDAIGAAADKVVATTGQLGGFVASSQVEQRDDGTGGASFDLRVPAARLQVAITRLSALGHVRSLSQNATDVTAEYRSAQGRLNDALAQRRALLRRLEHASTDQQAAAIRARLRLLRAEIDGARAGVRAIRRQAQLASIQLTLTPRRPAHQGASGHTGWGPGASLRRAGHVLAVVAGVIAVALAALAPLAVAGLAAWAVTRTVRRRRREHALNLG